MIKKVPLLVLIFFIVFFNTIHAQYGTFYKTDRNLESYQYYKLYLSFLDSYNSNKNLQTIEHKLDSLIKITKKNKDYYQYLFLSNELANLIKMNGQFNRAYTVLNNAMQFFAKKTDTIHIEYSVSQRLLRTTLTNVKNPPRVMTELFESQKKTLELLNNNGEPMTNLLVDYGLYLNRTGQKNKALEMLLKAHAQALNNNDFESYAVANYSIINMADNNDLAETCIFAMQNDIELFDYMPYGAPKLIYTSFYNHSIGMKYFNYFYNHKKSRQYNINALKCIDTINYPNWNLKATINSVIALTYSIDNDTTNFYKYYNSALSLVDTKPMSDRNRCMVYTNICQGALNINTDTCLMLIDKIKNNGIYNLDPSVFNQIYFTCLIKTNQNKKVTELISHDSNNKINIDNYSLPVVSDSVDYYYQANCFINLFNAYNNINTENNINNIDKIFAHIIEQQHDAALKYYLTQIYGLDIPVIDTGYTNFTTQSINTLLAYNNYNNLIFKIIQSSKAVHLNNTIHKNKSQSFIESGQNSYASIIENAKQIQQIKSQLNQQNLSATQKKQLKSNLANSYISFISQKLITADSLPNFENNFTNPTVTQVQTALLNNEALIEYYITDSSLVSMLVLTDTFIIKHQAVNNLQQLIQQKNYSLKTGSITNNLEKIIFAPLEKHLVNIDKLIIIPDKELLQLPFESLYLEQNADFLIEKFEVTYNYSTTLWYNNITNKKYIANNNILAVAPVFFDKNQANTNATLMASNYRGNVQLAPLLNTYSEVYSIKDIAANNNTPVTVITDTNATEYNVKKVLGNYNIIHFATHGLSNKDNAELSGLVLYKNTNTDTSRLNEDNFLSIGELYNIKTNANLVVLSACNSGSGKIIDSEGIIALPRGFIYAGVHNVIASLWKVHDQRTKELMTAFYHHLLNNNVSYSKALHLAKLDCINNGFLPIDWAGFVIIGY